MGFLSLLKVASMPIVQVLLISTLGAFMATDYLKLLSTDSRRSLNKDGSPFGDKSVCSTIGLSYVSFSMALGAFFIWTYAYHLIRSAGVMYRATQIAIESAKEPNKDLESDNQDSLLRNQSHLIEAVEKPPLWNQMLAVCHKIGDELLSPPVIAAVIGFIFGTVTFLRNLIIGDSAPLKVIQDSLKLLGDGTIPSITLILGGNLTQGLRKSRVKTSIIIAVLCVRYIILPIVGIGVVKAASHLGFIPTDPLFRFVLLIQFTLPPAMNLATMTQLFDVAQAECAILFLWTYLAAALALTGWSTVFMWLLS
ncbi:auxin efflux carrier family protein [Dorcoceras hygrometricum]|uniref:Auxin efflux carrier family protein n=1 Tax=Dorcoceras hygrometricum TaxID=472368 RepID=A0A2Z7C4A7_9LAMI|nr:auxin efflux carrier family protein [Dorcoceras hygrometricum]